MIMVVSDQPLLSTVTSRNKKQTGPWIRTSGQSPSVPMGWLPTGAQISINHGMDNVFPLLK